MGLDVIATLESEVRRGRRGGRAPPGTEEAGDGLRDFRLVSHFGEGVKPGERYPSCLPLRWSLSSMWSLERPWLGPGEQDVSG